MQYTHIHIHTLTHSECECDSVQCAPDVVFALKSPKELFHFKAQAGLQRHHGKRTQELKQLRIIYSSEDLEKAKKLSSRIISCALLVLIRAVDFGQKTGRRSASEMAGGCD